jgi:hypothetical protein
LIREDSPDPLDPRDHPVSFRTPGARIALAIADDPTLVMRLPVLDASSPDD